MHVSLEVKIGCFEVLTLGSSTTRGWAWPSLAAKAAMVAWYKERYRVKEIYKWVDLIKILRKKHKRTSENCYFESRLEILSCMHMYYLGSSLGSNFWISLNVNSLINMFINLIKNMELTTALVGCLEHPTASHVFWIENCFHGWQILETQPWGCTCQRKHWGTRHNDKTVEKWEVKRNTVAQSTPQLDT